MNVLVTLEQRFDRTPDGAVWTPNAFPHAFFQRYLKVFSGVEVLARVREVAHAPETYARADGPGVRFLGVPCYLGPWQYLQSRPALRRAVSDAACGNSAAILRLPSPIGGLLWRVLRTQARPYGVEVVGDPFDVFAPGVVAHPLRPLLRIFCSGQLRRQCLHAAAAAYVTRAALQKRYPCAGYSSVCSDVELPPLRASGRPEDAFEKKPLRLIAVGSLAQLYKGPDLLLKALARCTGHGLDLTLRWIGDGAYRSVVAGLASDLNLSERVRLAGALPAAEVVRELDAADLFVMPSRTEGLPRALLEAMARGLPCLGSRVGGIPELLTPEDLFAPNDVTALAVAIAKAATRPKRLAAMSARNLETARAFRPALLEDHRQKFYLRVLNATERWAGGRLLGVAAQKTSFPASGKTAVNDLAAAPPPHAK